MTDENSSGSNIDLFERKRQIVELKIFGIAEIKSTKNERDSCDA